MGVGVGLGVGVGVAVGIGVGADAGAGAGPQLAARSEPAVARVRTQRRITDTTLVALITCDLVLLAEEVLEQVVAQGGEDGLGMELDPLYRVLPVPHAHDLPTLGAGRDLPDRGHALRLNDQGMVPAGLKGVGQAPVYGPAVVVD